MRCVISIFIVTLLIPSLCFAGQTIPDSQQFILNEKDSLVDKSSFWMPSGEETQKALTAIILFLGEPDNHSDMIKPWHSDMEYAKGEISNIRRNFSKYGVQFVGVTLNGKKLIHCNFGPADLIGKDYLGVDDGGFWFWQIDYDMETGKLMNLQINGYA